MHNTTMTEDIYLQRLIIRRESVWCFLASGVRLQGIIRSHHEEAIFLESPRNSGGELMMIFKSQISSVMPTSMGFTKSSAVDRHGILAENSMTPNG